MLVKKIADPSKPLPWQWFEPGKPRQVVMVIVYHPKQQSLLLTQPVNDPTEMVWLPIQGAINQGESVFDASQREAKEEVISFARTSPRQRVRLMWHRATYLGSASNPLARSGRPSEIHVVSIPADYMSLRVDPSELRTATWVYDAETAEALLSATRSGNPSKYQLIAAGVRSAMST